MQRPDENWHMDVCSRVPETKMVLLRDGVLKDRQRYA